MSSDDFDPYHDWLGIEPTEGPVDHYRLLGLTRFESDPRTIADAADERMRLVRTFQTGPRGVHTQRLLNELSAARLRLLDPVAKATYDERLRASPEPGAGDDPFRIEGEIVLPPVLESPEIEDDLMAPLDPSRVDGSEDSARSVRLPSIQTGPHSRPGISGRSPRKQARKASHQGRSASRPRSPRGPTWHLATFVLGAGGLAVGIWYFGSFVFPGTGRNSTLSTSNPVASRSDSPTSGPIAQQSDGRVLLTAENATIHGSTPKRSTSASRTLIRDWRSPEDFLSWKVQFQHRTLYRARLTYSVDESASSGSIRISIGEQSKDWDLRSSGVENGWVTDEFPLGTPQSGLETIAIQAVAKPGDEVMRFMSLELEPIRRSSR